MDGKPVVERSPPHATGLDPSYPSEGHPAGRGHQGSPPPAVLAAVEEFKGDALTRSLLGQPLWSATQLERSQVSSSQVSIRQASARLSEMDRQLASLQNIADQMDQEFANTRLVMTVKGGQTVHYFSFSSFFFFVCLCE